MGITINDKKYLKEGGPNSGNLGHAGRPGERGGSSPGGIGFGAASPGPARTGAPPGEKVTAPKVASTAKAATEKKPRLKLTGEDGNAFAILGKAFREARRAGWSPEKIKEYKDKATKGDYDNLLAVTTQYFNVESYRPSFSSRVDERTRNLEISKRMIYGISKRR